MAEQEQAAVVGRLHEAARLLRGEHYLGPEARQALADFVDDLAEQLKSVPLPPVTDEHLAQAAGRLVTVLHQKEPGPLAEARDRLEEAVLAAEGRAPVVAGLARQLLDALAKLGI